MVSFTPRTLYLQEKSPWYALDKMLGEPESRYGRGGKEKDSQPPPGIEPYKLRSSDRSIELSWLSLLKRYETIL